MLHKIVEYYAILYSVIQNATINKSILSTMPWIMHVHSLRKCHQEKKEHENVTC